MDVPNILESFAYLERVLVQHVERVARELNASIAVALDQVRVLVAYIKHIELVFIHDRNRAASVSIQGLDC